MKREDLKNRPFHPERKWFLATAITGLLIGALFSSFIRDKDNPEMFCSPASYKTSPADPTPIQLEAIVHYATSPTVPQLNLAEISISLAVLKSRAPCNFLVFGLGHDSLMWASLNPRGKTLFLEDDSTWIQTVLKYAPFLRAHHVLYRTHASEADDLRNSYRSEPNCSPTKAYLRGNEKCKLALTGIPDEVYDTEWDLIMIDAPKGYSGELPGRMGVIFSAAVMARQRKGSGVTHVFLHNIDRRVEKVFAEEFLCRKHLVNSAGRLGHFEIPPAANVSSGGEGNTVSFC